MSNTKSDHCYVEFVDLEDGTDQHSDSCPHRPSEIAVEKELARLRERVGELEAQLERVRGNAAAFHERGERCQDRCRLLLEALRWLVDYARQSGCKFINGDMCYELNGSFMAMRPPKEIAPLIAEAVEIQHPSGLGPNGECPICGAVPCKPGCQDGSEIL